MPQVLTCSYESYGGIDSGFLYFNLWSPSLNQVIHARLK